MGGRKFRNQRDFDECINCRHDDCRRCDCDKHCEDNKQCNCGFEYKYFCDGKCFEIKNNSRKCRVEFEINKCNKNQKKSKDDN